MYKYLKHFKHNLTLILWFMVITFGLYVIIEINLEHFFDIKLNLTYEVLIISFIISFSSILIQSLIKLHNNSTDLSYYDLKKDEKLFYEFDAQIFDKSFIKGKFLFTDYRLIFIPELKFNNFYFDIKLGSLWNMYDLGFLSVIEMSSDNRIMFKVHNYSTFRNNYKEVYSYYLFNINLNNHYY